ncbi:MAG: hypothetical protein ACI4Q4_04275 [Oscillospiraceae bacterium]
MENANIKELLEKLQSAKSAEELVEMAKAEGAEIAPDKAEELFAKLNAEGELSDEDIENIAGGEYRVFKPRKPVTRLL